MANFGDLPTELKQAVMGQASAKTLRSLRRVDKSTREVLQDEIFWKNKVQRELGEVTLQGTWRNTYDMLTHTFYIPTVAEVEIDRENLRYQPIYQSLGIYPSYRLALEVLIEEYLKYFLRREDDLEDSIELYSDTDLENLEDAPTPEQLDSLRTTLREIRTELLDPRSQSGLVKRVLDRTVIGKDYYEWLLDWLDQDLKSDEIKIRIGGQQHEFFITESQLKL